jgi:hypothetical protein
MPSRLMLRAAAGLLWVGSFLALALGVPRLLLGDDAALAPVGGEGSYEQLPQLTDGTPCPSCRPRYWIVSSRCAAQDLHDFGQGHLQYYERTADGRLVGSSPAAMAGGFIPGAPVMVFLHGAYVSWEDNCVQSDETWRWIRRACPNRQLNVVFFTWPSDRSVPTLLIPCELNRRARQAETNAFYVACVLSQIPDSSPVCLVGHSYGARMAVATLHLAAGGSVQGKRFSGSVGCKRIRAVLAAGAFDHNWINDGGCYCYALRRAECILNLVNRHDIALKGYPLLRPFARRAIGASGVTWLDRRHQTHTDRIRNVDVTGLVGHGHFWPNYYECIECAGFLVPWVYFPDVNPVCTQTVMLPLEEGGHLPSPAPPAPPMPPASEAAPGPALAP